jgi:protein phosphatase
MADRWQGALDADCGWVLVADGMGGHAAGEVASRIAIDILRPFMSGLREMADVVRALNEANCGLYAEMAADNALEGMGTTIAGAVVWGTTALLFNVGDSRIYLLRAGRLRQVSEDHVIGGNMLTRCLGGTPSREDVEPYVDRLVLGSGDRLLLCTDGLTDMVKDPDIEALLAQDRPGVADALVAAALAAGGADNVTAAVIAFD